MTAVFDQAAQCGAKVPYSSRSAARRRARQVRGTEAYHCPHCGWWHVGGRPPAQILTTARERT